MTVKTSSQTKRHCMVVHAYYPLGETRVQRQAEALIANNIEVDVICLCGRRTAETIVVNGVKVYRLPVARWRRGAGFIKELLEYLDFFWRAMVTLIRLHRRHPYQVVQVHNLPDFLIYAAWYPKLRGAKLILDLHDLMPEFFAARTKKDLNDRLVRLIAWQERVSCWFADQVVTVTELWRQSLIKRGVPADKVAVVMNLADDRMFYRSTNGNHRNTPNGLHILYHGALVPRYGVDLIVKAVAKVQEQIPDIRLTIHGDGSFRYTLMDLVKELGISNHVNFSHKFLPMSELPDLIRTADVAVVPYRRDLFTDGILPTKLMEYVAVGVPVITVRTPAIEGYFDETMVEYFKQDDPGDLAARILGLYGNQSRLQSMVEQSERFNRDYNWAKQKANYVALVESLQ
jgi:glycosyltransferase involved in cell wall biosynthesis